MCYSELQASVQGLESDIETATADIQKAEQQMKEESERSKESESGLSIETEDFDKTMKDSKKKEKTKKAAATKLRKKARTLEGTVKKATTKKEAAETETEKQTELHKQELNDQAQELLVAQESLKDVDNELKAMAEKFSANDLRKKDNEAFPKWSDVQATVPM